MENVLEEFRNSFKGEIQLVISDIAKEIHESLQSLLISTMQNADKLEDSLTDHVLRIHTAINNYIEELEMRRKDFPSKFDDEVRRMNESLDRNPHFESTKTIIIPNDFPTKVDPEDTESFLFEELEKNQTKFESKEGRNESLNAFADAYIKKELSMKFKENNSDSLSDSFPKYEPKTKKKFKIPKPKKDARFGTFPCDSCKYVANRKDSMEKHVKAIHLQIKDYECNYCEFKTAERQNLKRHKFRHHKKSFELELKANFTEAQNQLLDMQKGQNSI